MVLPQLDDGTDIVDFLWETLPSLWSRWEVGGVKGVGGKEGGETGIWNVKNKSIKERNRERDRNDPPKKKFWEDRTLRKTCSTTWN